MSEIYKEVPSTDYRIVDVICNRCHQSCAVEFGFDSAFIMANWGYGSKWDGERHTATLCRACYDELLEVFGVVPDIKE